MSKIGEKYIAGFLDSDGYISVRFRGPGIRPKLIFGFDQKTEQSGVLYLIQERIGGAIREREIKGNSYTRLTLVARKAEKALNRIKKHLILKRHYAEACLQLVECGERDAQEDRQWLKQQRRVACLPLPNYPPRQWLAGYFDGDGCITLSVRHKGAASLIARVTTSGYDSEGVTVLEKAFGGSIYRCPNREKVNWSLGLPPSKAEQFFGYFAKHLVIKRDQAYFILGCAAMGHYRDGKSIKAAMKHLKSRPHRLSDPEAGVPALLSEISDKQWGRHGRRQENCSGCGTSEQPHYAKGMCRVCYHINWNRPKRQSDTQVA